MIHYQPLKTPNSRITVRCIAKWTFLASFGLLFLCLSASRDLWLPSPPATSVQINFLTNSEQTSKSVSERERETRENDKSEDLRIKFNELGRLSGEKLGRFRFQANHYTNRPKKEFLQLDDDQKTRITVATVACGEKSREALVLAKSAAIFTQHAKLHLIVFTDNETVTVLGESLLKLKSSVQQLGWDFSFELQLEWFPTENTSTWRNMWSPCSTQRLFFPSLLPHVDSLIYLDADTIVMSNLSVFWNQFEQKMSGGQIGAMAANTEHEAKGWYGSSMNHVPYYGKRGLNAGAMLMNLTRMREFHFEEKAVQIYKEFKGKIQLADQDIMNIMFNKDPDKMTELSCTFNFVAYHCPQPGKSYCYLNAFTNNPVCYCKDIAKIGVNIVHGNLKAFHNPNFPFLQKLFQEFEKFDILQESYESLLRGLMEDFKTYKSPCFSLTAEQLYGNAMKYLV